MQQGNQQITTTTEAKEFSNTDFTEVNFKKWLKNVEVNERRHLTKEFLKKARSIA